MNRVLHRLGFVCLGVALFTVSGCAAWASSQRALLRMNYPHAGNETLTQSPQEHYHSATRVSLIDTLGLVEDMDLLFMTDRPTRLSRWQDR